MSHSADGEQLENDSDGILDRELPQAQGGGGFSMEPPSDQPADDVGLPTPPWAGGSEEPIRGRGRTPGDKDGTEKIPKFTARLHPSVVQCCIAWWMHERRNQAVEGNPAWPSWEEMLFIYLAHVAREHAAMDIFRKPTKENNWNDQTQYDWTELHMDGFREEMREEIRRREEEAARIASKDAKQMMGQRLLKAVKSARETVPREILELIAEEMGEAS